ncbi:MAG: hypothetical protein JSU75_05800 [Gammaproteobacteria bacterium]|nr:MAG: hypothetical protein JSU75_05800 [Gammaproteobacteria bacterium]
MRIQTEGLVFSALGDVDDDPLHAAATAWKLRGEKYGGVTAQLFACTEQGD